MQWLTPKAGILCDMSGKRKAAGSADQEAERLWAALTRVVALTPEALATCTPHVATLKLDGVRVCLSCKAGVCCRVDAWGRRQLEAGAPHATFVLDAEEHEGVYWVFDALMAQGRDLRALALADRLRWAAALLEAVPALAGTPLRLKPYSGMRTAAQLQRLFEAAAASPAVDGVIFCDLTAPYETPPLKFKPRLTVDFRLEPQPRLPPGTFGLLTQRAGRLQPFRLRGKACLLATSAEERLALGLPEALGPGDVAVVECALPCERRGRWRALRLRPDRRHPNCLSTVLDTLDMRARGLDQACTLAGLLPPLGAQPAFDVWLAVLRRRLLWADGGRVGGTELHGSTRAGSEGSVPVDRCRLALPLKGEVALHAYFSLAADELEQLLAVLRLWLGGAPHRALRLRLALQLRPAGLAAADARYFRTILDLPQEALLAKAARALGAAASLALAPLEDAQPPELLELPAELAAVAASTYVLTAVVGAPGGG